MVSSVSETRVEPGVGIAIVVDHDPRDSYSRSVGPCARKQLQRSATRLLEAGWSGTGRVFESWDYSEDNPETGKARTVVRFSIKNPDRETLGIPST